MRNENEHPGPTIRGPALPSKKRQDPSVIYFYNLCITLILKFLVIPYHFQVVLSLYSEAN